MNELEQYIKSYFGLVSISDVQTIVSLFKPQIIKKGDYLLKAEKQCTSLSFVQSGFLRMYSDSGNKEVTQWISGKGFFATDLSSFIFETPSRWHIQAIADSEIYRISKTDYDRIGNMVPAWHQLEKLFIARCFSMLEDRIYSHLSMSAEARYHTFFEQNKELFTQVPLQYIASMLGMTPETFSRIRKKQLA